MKPFNHTPGGSETTSSYFTKLPDQRRKCTHPKLDVDNETIGTESGVKGRDGFRMGGEETNGEGAKRQRPQTADSYKRKRIREKEAKNEVTDEDYTPLERQYLQLKEKYPDVLLLIETGYLYRFFGHDAEVAAQVLKFSTSRRHHFVTTSLPIHRMYIHIRQLVALGHKVGVVRKMETALMKATGDDQHSVFKRELVTLYSKSTLIGEEVDPPVSSEGPARLHTKCHRMSYLMSLYELPIGNGNTRIGLFAVCPLSGDMIYDCFIDEDRRQNLENRFARIRPVEVLVPRFSLSEDTERAIATAVHCGLFDDEISVERMADEFFKFPHAEKMLRDFYDDAANESDSVGFDTFSTIATSILTNIPPPVICCMGATLTYLKDFKLDRIFRLAKEMKEFSPSSHHVYLDARTIHSLELFRSKKTGDLEGSLLWLLDQTSTAFGSRLLHTWLSHPLTDSCEIQHRLDAVNEIIKQTQAKSFLMSIKSLLEKLPDLESAIMAIFYKKCSTKKYWKTVSSLIHVKQQLESLSPDIYSKIAERHLKTLLLSMVSCLQGIENLRENIDEEAACKGHEHRLFKDLAKCPTLNRLRELVLDTKRKLDALRPGIAARLGRATFDFSKFADKEFVIVIGSSRAQYVPTDWKIVAQTSRNVCFRTPEMEPLVWELKLLEEQFKYESHLMWLKYLDNFRCFYYSVRKAVANLATLDCYFSFAALAQSQDFVKPHLECEAGVLLDLRDVWDPVIDQLLGPEKQFVCNSTKLSSDGPICRLITGANMGGKTTYVRAVAIVAILVQIGSFIPASAVRMTPLDAIFARSGVRDNIMKGQSAFYTEAGETSEILARVTSRSLVVLDEFGRSTSDSDGASLACGIIHYLITKVQCMSLIVTRFPEVTKLQTEFPNKVENFHVAVLVQWSGNPDEEDQETVTYLYRLTEGACDKCYSRNVCRMAGIEEGVLGAAERKSTEVERNNQKGRAFVLLFWRIFHKRWEEARKNIQSLKMCDFL